MIKVYGDKRKNGGRDVDNFRVGDKIKGYIVVRVEKEAEVSSAFSTALVVKETVYSLVDTRVKTKQLYNPVTNEWDSVVVDNPTIRVKESDIDKIA